MMNPTTTPTHPYVDEHAAHQAFLRAIHARRLDCITIANEAMTKDEKTFWGKYENYLGIVERSLTRADGMALNYQTASSTRATLKANVESELTKLLDRARTTTEKEIVGGCLEALEEGLRLHANHTGIY